MIEKIVLITAFLFFKILFCQKPDAVYYDKDWNVTAKTKASYYRLAPLKQVGELVLLQDFYLDGTPQFEGYTLKNDEDTYVGDVVWYDENGNDNNFRQHRNDTKNHTLLYYHTNGKIRKKVQYKDGVKDGEIIIFDDTGEVLMKGIYIKGKPDSGDFETLEDDYESGGSDEVVTTGTVMVEPQTVYSEPIKAAKKKVRKTISQKIFWKNSRNIAQEKIYAINSYHPELIQQKNYDVSGKLIQTVSEDGFEKYNRDLLNGIEYIYYLHNNFATGIRSAATFSKGEKSGKQTFYFPKGGVSYETNYRNGLKDGEEIVFSESGSVKNKRIYKEGEPFHGNFEESMGDISIHVNYINSFKEGEAVAKNEQGQVVAKGVYKKGEPFKGTFIIAKGDEGKELITVEDFQKSGLQKVFGYRLEDLEKTYTVQNEKLNGMTTFYKDGKPVANLEYKNGEPYNGILVASDKTSVYKNGKTVEETYYKDSYSKEEDNIQKQKIYENGILSKIRDYSFVIAENPQSSYEGIFKNEKPYSGYFETEVSREFKKVDYFENGIPKFQYSNDYLKNMDNFRHQSYDIKSIYKDGKIDEGVEYVLNEKQFISRYWKNGKLQSFDWDLFAMHYFNRIHFELKDNAIQMNDLQDKKSAEITIDISPGEFKKQLLISGKLVDVKTNHSKDQKRQEGIILYYEEDGKIISKMMETLNQTEEPGKGNDLFYKVYISINESPSVQDVFNKLSENVLINRLIQQGTDENKIITGLRTDSSGKPKDGILIISTQDNKYTLQLYLNGQRTKTIERVSFEKIEDEVRKLERVH